MVAEAGAARPAGGADVVLAVLAALAALADDSPGQGGLAGKLPDLFAATAGPFGFDAAALYRVGDDPAWAESVAFWCAAGEGQERLAAVRRLRADVEPLVRALRDGVAVEGRGDGLAPGIGVSAGGGGVQGPFVRHVVVPVDGRAGAPAALYVANTAGAPAGGPSVEAVAQLARALAVPLARLRLAADLDDTRASQRQLLATMGVGVVYYGADGAIVDADPGAQAILGRPLEEWRGHSSDESGWRTVREDGSELPAREYPGAVAFRTCRPVPAQTIGLSRPGEDGFRWLLVAAAPEIRTDEAAPARVVVTFQDVTERRLAEQRLQASEDQFRRLAENAPAVIYRLSVAPLRVEYVSPAIEAVSGYTPAELRDDPAMLWRLIHPDDARLLREIVADRTGLKSPRLMRWVTRQGDLVWTEQHVFPVLGADGQIASLEGVAVDVTKRRQAEAEAARAAAVTAATLESTTDGILVTDLEDRWLRHNPRFLELWGLPDAGWGGSHQQRRGEAFATLADPAAFEAVFRRLLAEPSATWAGDVATADGRVLSVTSVPLVVDGRTEGRTWNYRDVTERRRVAAEAVRSAALTQAALESTADGILVIGLDERWIIANQRFADMWKIPAEVVAGGSPEDYRDAATAVLADPRAFGELYARLTTDWSEVWTGDLPFRDGRVFLLYTQPLMVGDAASGRVFSFRDITAVRQAEVEARQTAARLSRTLDGALAAMGSVVELRDPYTSGHQKRVTQLAGAIATEMGLPAAITHTVRLAASAHDIGQLVVPAEILTRPGRLSPIEMQLVRQHAEAGREILSQILFDRPIAAVVGQHHERLDGSGYPAGLRGGSIMLEARVLAVADVVEAMSSHRPYRPALGVEAALHEVRRGAGSEYDEDVVAACERVFAGGFVFD